jgi:hypothetical protein
MGDTLSLSYQLNEAREINACQQRYIARLKWLILEACYNHFEPHGTCQHEDRLDKPCVFACDDADIDDCPLMSGGDE